jgi:iron(III) transport system substrate-binding protein
MPIRGLLATLSALVLCTRALAGDVVVYSPHGTDIRDEFSAGFEASHPGTRVRWLDMGAAEVLERLRAERAGPRAHVWWGAPATFFTLAAGEGLLEPYRPAWADVVGDYARGEADLWFGQFDLPIGIGHVPGRIPEADLPRSWDDLVAPEAAGRLLIRDPPASGTMKTFLAAMVLRQADEEAGMAWLARLHARTRGYTASPNLLFQKLARGEGDLTVWNVTDLLFQKARYGYPFAAILPEEGVPVITDSIALVKGAGDEARAFYDHVTTIEANLRLAADHFRVPTRRDLPKDRLPEWLTELDYRPLPLDRGRMVSEMEGWVARWEREVRGGGGTTSFWLAGVAAAASLLIATVAVLARRRRRALENV